MSNEIKKAVQNLIETINNKPQIATTVFRASSFSEQDGFAVRSQIRGFSTVMDEPLELGGTDTGPNPVEMLLAALGGCQEIVYRAYAAVMGLEIERIEVHAKGYLDLRGLLNLAEVPSGFSQISFTTRIVSAEPEHLDEDGGGPRQGGGQASRCAGRAPPCRSFGNSGRLKLRRRGTS